MKHYRGYQKYKNQNGSVVTIGNFDGVHSGHRKIIQNLITISNEKQLDSVVYTFRPHPQIALRPQANVSLLSTYDEKVEMMAEFQLDAVIEEPFTREFSSFSPKEFFEKVLLDQLHCRYLIVGYDFGFGKDRSGSMEILKDFCLSESVQLEVISPYQISGQTVSSTAIRNFLNQGSARERKSFVRLFFFLSGTCDQRRSKRTAVGISNSESFCSRREDGSSLWCL